MEQKKKIDYIKPEVISYAHHAYPLGMIRKNLESDGWFYSNYIHMYYAEGINQFNFLVEYVNNPFIDMRHVYKDEFDDICLEIGLKEWICREIDKGNSFEIMIDYFFLPTSRYFKREHKLHEILIVGYDKAKCCYWDFVDGIYKENACEWSEVVPFDSKLLYGEGIAAKIIRVKKSTYEFDLKIVLEELIDYVYSVNLYCKIALWGDHHRYKNCTFGISCMQMLQEYLEKQKYGCIDYRYINVFYEHKKCMQARVNYIKQTYHMLLNDRWGEIVNKWHLLLWKCIKYNIHTFNGSIKKEKYIEIQDEIERLFDLEKDEIEKLIEIIKKSL